MCVVWRVCDCVGLSYEIVGNSAIPLPSSRAEASDAITGNNSSVPGWKIVASNGCMLNSLNRRQFDCTFLHTVHTNSSCGDFWIWNVDFDAAGR